MRWRSSSSVSELAHFLRELVVERQQFLAPDALDRDVVVDRGACQFGHLVVGRIRDRERARVAGRCAGQVLVESGRVVGRAKLDCDVLQRLRLVVDPSLRRASLAGDLDDAGTPRAREVQQQRVASAPRDDPRRDASARRAAGAARAPGRLRPTSSTAGGLRTVRPGVFARIDRWHRFEIRHEGQRLTFLDARRP